MVEIGKKEPLKKHNKGKIRGNGPKDKQKKAVVKKSRAAFEGM